MYGTPGPGYHGHNEAENKIDYLPASPTPDPILKVGPPRKVKMTYPEYSCLYPTVYYRKACESDCPEEVREGARCQRNGYVWTDRVAELRAEREREKTEREKEKVSKNKKEIEDDPE